MIASALAVAPGFHFVAPGHSPAFDPDFDAQSVQGVIAGATVGTKCTF